MISGHVHLLSILSWGILVYQTSMSFCCTSFYNAGLGFAPGTARKIIHTGKLLLVNRGFNIYDNKRIGTIPASVAEELLGIELQKEA